MTAHSLTWLLDRPFFLGTAFSADVPGKFPIGLAGHSYMLDMLSDQNGLRGQYFRRESIPVLRSQADQSTVPNESSINPDDMWRRSQDSWHLGAGQVHLDRQVSSPYRFRSSKGMNVWSRNAATLLQDTANALASVNNVLMVTAGTYTYLIDGQALKYSNNITAASPSFTTVTGTPANTPTSLTSDGYTIYVAYTTGVYTTTRGAAAATAAGDTNAYTLLGYSKGRLLGAINNVLYNITSLAAPSAALYTHPNSDFTWVGFSGAAGKIYAAGYSGDKSLIYSTSVKADGTALDIPKVAGELPDGEIIRSVLGYLGIVVLGSDIGVRLANPDGNGDLTVGGLINTGTSVRCLVGYDRFIWFGWTNYDSTSTGLGRLDLQNFTSTDTPAYASDLMATAQGTVRSVIVMSGSAVFSVDAHGIYNPSVNLVASGSIDSGLIAYDLADAKTAMYLNLTTLPLPAGASVVTALSVDSGSFTTVGTHSTASGIGPHPDYPAGQMQGETFEIRQSLTRATVTTTGPTLRRHTLRVYATPSRSYDWTLPLLIHEKLDPYGGSEYALDVMVETDFLMSLLNSLVTLQVGAESFQVFIQDVVAIPFQVTQKRDGYAGTVVVHAKQPAAQ